MWSFGRGLSREGSLPLWLQLFLRLFLIPYLAWSFFEHRTLLIVLHSLVLFSISCVLWPGPFLNIVDHITWLGPFLKGLYLIS